MNVLIVEDSSTDALLAQSSLTEDRSFHTSTVFRLSDALEQLRARNYDVVLLDLGLPDSQGLDTLHAVIPHRRSDTAIVVLTGNDDRTQGALALRSGAQDYLFKNHLGNGEVLRRCVTYAHERRIHLSRVNALERELDLARREERRNEETAFWSRLAGGSPLDTAAPDDAGGEVLDASPETLQILKGEYSDILEESLDERIRKAPIDSTQRCSRLAARLGELGATPRDVVNLHLVVLREKMDESVSLVRAMAYQEEARLRIVELMGFLAAYYRALARPGSSPLSP